MAVIKLVEDYAVSQLRKDVRDALILGGEQSIVLQLFHAEDADVVPCPQCGDDFYKSPEKRCTICYGTMFEGGVRKAMKVWALYTDHQVSEQLGPRGVYEPDHRSVTFEAFPEITEHDVLVRVRSWTDANTPEQIEGFYLLEKVDRRSLRTGSRFGQSHLDVVSQKCQLAELPGGLVDAITRYPIVGEQFEASIDLTAATGTIPAQAVIEPDVRVIYFPFEPEPGGIAPEGGSTAPAGITFTQTVPSATWTIPHTLGYEPDVSIIVGGEEVEADVDFPNNSVVVITFTQPVSGTARLT